MTKLALIAGAVPMLASLPVFADGVEFYGKLYPEFNHYRMKGATAEDAEVATIATKPSGTKDYSGETVESSNSRLGVRGDRDLRGGFKAIFQAEATLPVDSGVKSSTFFNRDTFVGLASEQYGTIKLGILDTVYKNMAETASFLGVSSGNFVSISNIIARQGFGNNAASSFHVRRQNTLYYETPFFGGFQSQMEYAVGEKTAEGAPEPWLASYAIQCNVKTLHLAVAQEIHHDFFGGSLNMPTAALRTTDGKSSNDISTRFTAMYTFPSRTRVDVNYAITEFKEKGGPDGHFKDYKHNTYSVGLDQKVGQWWSLAAQYGAAEKGSCQLMGNVECNTDGLDGQMISVGASYALAKGVAVFGLYSWMINGRSAVYSNVGEAPAPTTGADIEQAAIGLLYTF
ncbi:MAG: porin [Solimonas sp.]